MRRFFIPPRSALRVMSRKRPGRDADGMALNKTPPLQQHGADIMQFFSSLQSSKSNAKLPNGAPLRCVNSAVSARKLDCGWYDSSFDLSEGLEVIEQDNDTMYQLWELSLN